MIQSIEGVQGVMDDDQEAQPLSEIISCYKELKEMRNECEAQSVNNHFVSRRYE